MSQACQPTPPLLTRSDGAPTFDGFGERLLCIEGLEHMNPFFMTIVSDADLWMFVSSAGGLTCGRRQPSFCLFPYETDDRLHAATGLVGPVTLLRVGLEAGEPIAWQPFAQVPAPGATRNLYKTELGNRVIFEEVHHELGLTFRYQWANAGSRGFVRTSELARHADAPGTATVEALDGLLGVMPAGVEVTTQQRASALVNAYRRTELHAESAGLAMYRLSALIVDKAEPAEALSCNLAYSAGLEEAKVLLGAEQVQRFRIGQPTQQVAELRGRPGNYLLEHTVTLAPGQHLSWDIVADVRLSATDVVRIRNEACASDAREALRAEIKKDDLALRRRLASADAVQHTADPVNDAHHLANVLFNCMRGGVFEDGYSASRDDVRAFLSERNRVVAERNADFLASLPDRVNCLQLVEQARASGDRDLLRLSLEYLPLTFSRRHGDPSRPWNQFDIRVHHPDGSDRIYYQGNWRDIFQNWEALSLSYPGFLPNIIATFVNASTADGFNPYRISRDGIDWEVPEPEDPWSNIGYWGDHQIVYLTRLLELEDDFWPGQLSDWLTESVFSYADVPYRITPYANILRDPRNTIDFDEEHQQAVLQRVSERGADGRLLTGPDGEVVHVTLTEKLLVPILAKLCNLVLDGGIWMNTQRPEWNDANNALAGFGLSMVTLYQLRRHLTVCAQLAQTRRDDHVPLSAEVGEWFEQVHAILQSNLGRIDQEQVTDADRRALLDQLGGAFDGYRARLYRDGLSAGAMHSMASVLELFESATRYLDHAIRANRREDGLFHAYNLVNIDEEAGTASVSHLYEMLEGQVAVLSSGVLSGEESLQVIDGLFASRMHRADQDSFMLYPDRQLPAFLDQNVIPKALVDDNPLLGALLDASNRLVVERDEDGVHHFAATLRNALDLEAALDLLAREEAFEALVAAHRERTLEAWEAVFHHHAFTGRSGTMYGYEGLGCIYWHMVSKLLLAVQETLQRAQLAEEPAAVIEALADRYAHVRAGLGSAKTAQTYGAFPTDPYSHSPKHAGAQQPGMTGQVKEEIRTRFGELGLTVRAGGIQFGAGLLERDDFAPGEAPELHFTFAEVPITYRLTDDSAKILLSRRDGPAEEIAGLDVDPRWSRSIFRREGEILGITVHLPASRLRGRNPVDSGEITS